MKPFATATVAICLILILPGLLAAKGPQPKPPPLRAARQAENDLEVGGELAGLPAGSTRFVAYRDLLAMPQVTYLVTDDSNFPKGARLTGIPLSELADWIGAPTSKLVVAICYDGYRTNYSASYLAAHRPLLVLKIDGKLEPAWPPSEYRGRMGPYLISHPSFKPAFKVLSHTDEPQVPFGVTRLEFRDEQAVMASIAPRGEQAANSPVMQGYLIARQNCFRCHNMGGEGGQLAGRSWQILATWASTEPKFFLRYVNNPRSVDPKDRMPGFPQYDAETLEALRQYFASFAQATTTGAAK